MRADAVLPADIHDSIVELVARIDPQRAYPYFRSTQGWDRAMVDAQVLTALDDASTTPITKYAPIDPTKTYRVRARRADAVADYIEKRALYR